jgi:outer membrane receptor protein involved in Fe transport
LSASQGYRQVTLFSLDKAVHAGFDHVVLPGRLEPERTLSLNLGLQHEQVLGEGNWQANLSFFDVELWEKAILLYTAEAGHMEYGNARRAHSRGVEMRSTWRSYSGWRLGGGGTWSRVMQEVDRTWEEAELAGSWTANVTAGRSNLVGVDGLGAELRLRATGPQRMPEGRGRERTPAWSVLDAALEYRTWSWSLGLDVENILDYVQPDSPLSQGGEHEGMLDSALIYGPLIGRRARLRATFDF